MRVFTRLIVVESNSMQKWEYETLDLGSDTLHKELNELGQQGWELVGVQAIGEDSYVICKRPVDIRESAGRR